MVDDNRKLKDQLAELEQKRKMEDDELRHLVKMKESELNMKHETLQLERDRAKDAEVAKVKDQYRDKLEAFLQQQVKDIKEMYGEILGRLPNVNVRLKGEV
jgi:predicted metal-dependent hydrolase